MSAAEIADNKWELNATKPPVNTVAGIAQIALMVFFALFFLWIMVSSFIGIVTPKAEKSEYERAVEAKPAAE